MQRGTVRRNKTSWFLQIRVPVFVDGQIVRRQTQIKLCEISPRYAKRSDLTELIEEKLAELRLAAKKPLSATGFRGYVEDVYLPWANEAKRASTYAAYSTYLKRYVLPHVGKRSLRDFDVSVVAGILKDAAKLHSFNRATATKVRSVVSAVFAFAISEGHYPAKSNNDNPAHRAALPSSCPKPEKTRAATPQQVKAILHALRARPLERAAVAIMALLGTRPGECRGLR